MTFDCNYQGCPVEAALEVIGGKWNDAILHHLLNETIRFNELRRLMPEITQRMLTKQLRELAADNLISRKVYAEVRPKSERQRWSEPIRTPDLLITRQVQNPHKSKY